MLAMEAPNKLVTTFTIAPFNGRNTTITWILDEMCEGTRLTLIHEGIEQAAAESALHLLTALDKGWDAHFAQLRSVAI